MNRPDPTEALAELLAGNRRFAAGRSTHPHLDPDRRATLVRGQAPWATVLGCSDSRVPLEILFDRGLGDLFVVRTAGHVVDEAVLGSIEYGVEVLGVPLVVVLGHQGCGAVQASIEASVGGDRPGGAVGHVVDLVMPSVLEARPDPSAPDVDRVVAGHARRTAALLADRSPAVATRLRDGLCAVVAMEYRLTDGLVQVLEHARTQA